MSKTLESLKELKHWKETNNEKGVVWLPLFAVEDIEKDLTELEQIKNAKPSEAMEDLDNMANQVFQVDDHFEFYYGKVKQHILKAQENEKVLNIIKEKNVDLDEIRANATVKGYNSNIPYYRQSLTDEEFRLVKEWMRYE